MVTRISLTLAVLMLLVAGCDTVKAGGEFAMPVWKPQIQNATFNTGTGRNASVAINWRTGQAPFTVDVEMPSDFQQVQPITTSERSVDLSNLSFLVPEGTSGVHTYKVTIRVIDALGQTAETSADADFNFPAMP